MSDIVDANGLQIKTVVELISELEAALKGIYGNDINIDSNSPDGQMINIIAQAGIDLRELINEVYNSYNPDRASGVVLDERVTINNIERKGGTYTIQPVDITCDRTVSLQGLDGNYNSPTGTGYTVQDNSGNQFILIDSVTLFSGTTTVNFRAKDIGLVETTVDTITNPVTIVLGVTEVNNSAGALSVGENQETDAELRLRREQSVANASTGYLNGLLGDVLALDGVTSAKLYENYSGLYLSGTDFVSTPLVLSGAIPPHSIWLIVEGGASDDIAQEIYQKKSFGCGMKGDTEVDITTQSGQTFTAKFDRAVSKELFIRFNLKKVSALTVFDEDTIKSYLVNNLTYEIGESAETSKITCTAINAILAQGGGGFPLDVEVSLNGTDWTDYLTVDTLDEQWTLDANDITITEV